MTIENPSTNFAELFERIGVNDDYDRDEFDLAEFGRDIPSGLSEAGEYGWCNDVDWYEGVIAPDMVDANTKSPCTDLLAMIDDALAGLEWAIHTVYHADDYYENSRSSATCAWWSHSLIVWTKDLPEVESRLRASE